MARRKKRLVDSGCVASPDLPERFYHPATYFESHGPMTPSAFRAYSDDLRVWLESNCGVPAKASMGRVTEIMRDIDVLPSVWLDYAAREGIGYRHYESVRPEPVEVPENEPTVELVPALSTNPTYDELIAHIRGQGLASEPSQLEHQQPP